MRVTLPILHQKIENNELISTETEAVFDIDTSVYSEERWEQNFPELAAHEGLFDYIGRLNSAVSNRVMVACMLKALYCFMESEEIPTYKDFAKMFVLGDSAYLSKLLEKLHTTFNLILQSSSTKN